MPHILLLLHLDISALRVSAAGPSFARANSVVPKQRPDCRSSGSNDIEVRFEPVCEGLAEFL